MNPSIHEGKMLKQHLKKEGITYLSVQDRLNISSQSLYYQLRREYLTQKFKHKLAAIGINPFSADHSPNLAADLHYDELKREIKKLQEMLALQMKYIQELKESMVASAVED